MKKELRSKESTHGRRMAGARSLWRANGMKEDQFGKPIFAIANSFTVFFTSQFLYMTVDLTDVSSNDIQAVSPDILNLIVTSNFFMHQLPFVISITLLFVRFTCLDRFCRDFHSMGGLFFCEEIHLNDKQFYIWCPLLFSGII